MTIREKVDFLRSIFEEVATYARRGAEFDAKKVEELRIAILEIHQDYLVMLNGFESDVETIIFSEMGDNSSVDTLANAKRKFLKSREKMSVARWITKTEADGLLQGIEDSNAAAYFLSVIWYFHYHDCIGYGGYTHYEANRWTTKLHSLHEIDPFRGPIDEEWDSASTFLSRRIAEENNPTVVRESIRNARLSISERYANIVKYHTIFVRNNKSLFLRKAEKE